MGAHTPGSCRMKMRSVLILVAGFCCSYLALGLPFAAGFYTPEFLDYFGQSKSATAWVISINIAVLFGAGPISSMLTSRFNHRTICLFGCVCSATGFFCSAFVTELYHLYITHGVVLGLGCSLTYNASVVFVGLSFTKMRSAASGIVCGGAGLAILTLPPFFDWLIHMYTWRGSFIILSAICLQLCTVVMLLTPHIKPENTRHKQSNTEHYDAPDNKEEQAFDDNVSGRPIPRRSPQSHIILKEKHAFKDSKDICIQVEKIPSSPSHILVMFTDVNFLVYALSSFLWNMGTTCVFVFSASLFEDRLKFAENSSLIFTLIGVGNTVGRCLGGVSGNITNCHRPLYSTTTLLLTAILMITMPYAQTFTSFAVIFTSFGLIYGIMTGLVVILTVDLLGVEKLNLCFGYIMLACGLGSLIGPPIVGWVYDVFGTFFLLYLVSSCLVLISSLCMFILIGRNTCRMKSNSLEKRHFNEEYL